MADCTGRQASVIQACELPAQGAVIIVLKTLKKKKKDFEIPLVKVPLMINSYPAANLCVLSVFVQGDSLMVFPQRVPAVLSGSAKKKMYVRITLVPKWLSVILPGAGR